MNLDTTTNIDLLRAVSESDLDPIVVSELASRYEHALRLIDELAAELDSQDARVAA